MPDARTNIKITADDSGVRKLEKSLGKAFDKRGARELAVTAKGLEREFNNTVKTVTRLTAELQKASKGTAAYKALRDELKRASQEAQQLQRTLGLIEQISTKQERDSKRRANEGRRSFAGGLMQGLGVAQYMPAEPGMAKRAAGVMLGGAMRRGAGMATAPFLLPGMGGISQAMTGIPIVGPGMAGALNTAAGAYQTAVGFDRARWQALSFMGPNWGTTKKLGPSSEQKADLLAAQSKDKEAQEAFIQAQRNTNLAEQNLRLAQMKRIDPSRLTKGQRGMLRSQNALQKIQELTGGAPGAYSVAAGAGAPSVEATRIGGAKRWVGQARDEQQEARDNAEEAARQLSEAKSRAGRSRFGVQAGLPGAGAGVEFGLGPTQMMGMFTEFMRARGGVYDQGGQGQFREAMAAAARAGVGMQQAGGFARMGGAGGGGTGGTGLAEVLQSAFAEGLNGSQVTEYLQTLVQLGQQAERTGVKIDPQAFTRSSALFSRAGFEGLQAQRVTGGMNQAAMKLSGQGVAGPMDVLMARAAGFDPSQGPEGYARAMNKLSGGMTPEVLNGLLGSLTTGIQGSDFGPEMQSLMLRRAMQKMGVQVGPGQTSALLDAYKQGGGRLPSGTEELWAKGEEGGAREQLIYEARRRVGVGAGLTKGAAGLEATQVGVGYGAAKFVVGAERNQLKAALLMVNNFGDGLTKLNVVVGKAITGFDKLLKALEVGAGFSNLMSFLGGGGGGKSGKAPVKAGGKK